MSSVMMAPTITAMIARTQPLVLRTETDIYLLPFAKQPWLSLLFTCLVHTPPRLVSIWMLQKKSPRVEFPVETDLYSHFGQVKRRQQHSPELMDVDLIDLCRRPKVPCEPDTHHPPLGLDPWRGSI